MGVGRFIGFLGSDRVGVYVSYRMIRDKSFRINSLQASVECLVRVFVRDRAGSDRIGQGRQDPKRIDDLTTKSKWDLGV